MRTMSLMFIVIMMMTDDDDDDIEIARGSKDHSWV